MTYTPEYVVRTISLDAASIDSNWNMFSLNMHPSRILLINWSSRTIVWSFHRPGLLVVECRMWQRWLQVRLYVLVVLADLKPVWLFYRLYSHRSMMMCVQSISHVRERIINTSGGKYHLFVKFGRSKFDISMEEYSMHLFRYGSGHFDVVEHPTSTKITQRSKDEWFHRGTFFF